MADTVKVGFVGAGNRMRKYYLPVLEAMDGHEVVGFTTKTQETAASATEETGLKSYDNVQALDDIADLIIVCVPANVLHYVGLETIAATRSALLIETPIASAQVAEASWKLRDQRIIAAAENWPFRPMEVLKREMLDSGIFGRLNVVYNDFRGYEYHGMAMMRSFAGGALPKTAIGSSFSSGPVSFINEDGDQKTLEENWDFGVIELTNGVRLVHNFNSILSRCKTRGPRSLRLMCSNGSISNDDMAILDISYGLDGKPITPQIHVHSTWDGIISDRALIGGENAPPYLKTGYDFKFHDRTFSWKPDQRTLHFDDQQQSTCTLLQGMFDAVRAEDPSMSPYPAWQSFVDWSCVMGLRKASAWGSKIEFPKPAWMV